MDNRIINGITITVTGDTTITDDELTTYLNQIIKKNHHKIIKATIEVGEFVDVRYEYRQPPFERIRRITGYLVGTTERWGDAKKAELKDRVKHGGCE